MKVLYYDCFAGISGDMNLGAMVDVGVDPDYLIGELKKLNIDGYEIRISQQQRKGITGTQVEVLLGNEQEHSHEHHHEHGHGHGHGHGHHHDDHHHSHGHHHHEHEAPRFIYTTQAHTHQHTHEHRNLGDIEKIINESKLSDKVKKMSLKVFELVAQAEAKIHGKPLQEVHFHEVGAIDSIVDIVGAAICIDYLAPDKIFASPVEMGGGTVVCAHGTFPVPAPAALEIMKGKPMKLGAVPFETATPTGVAILAALADEFSDTPSLTISNIGYGIGHRDTDIPNVLRVCLGESSEQAQTAEAIMIECNIDDMNPEQYEYVMRQLFLAGAADVFMQNIMMKKSRPAITLSVLCAPEKYEEIEHILFTETSTLGVRYYGVGKRMLERKTELMDTPWGQVRIKAAYYQGALLKTKPEYDDCAAIARDHHISISKIYEYINKNNTKTL